MQLLKPQHTRDNNTTYVMLVWACTEYERNRIPRRVLYMNFKSKKTTEVDQETDGTMK
jgi:hypothetical protein